MLTEMQLHRYIEQHNLSQDVIDYIKNIRNNQPSRMVGAYARTNVCTWFYSEKMQRSISTESRTAERAFLIFSEYNDLVLEIWEQPDPIPIVRHTTKGNKKKGWYTPDFLVIRKDGIYLVEVKDENTVEKKLSSNTHDWVRQKNGSVNYIPASDFCQNMGIGFEVFVASKDMRYRVFNLEMMLQARQHECPEISEESLGKVFKDSFFWSLYDLKLRLNLQDYTPIFHAIDNGRLFLDINASLLSEPRSCYVVTKKETLPYVDEFLDKKVYNDHLLSSIEQLSMPSSTYAEEALSRLDKIKSGEKGRSIRRWKSKIAEGASRGLSDFQALIPRWFFSGNKQRKINKVVEEFLLQYLIGPHAEAQGLSDYRSYIRYKIDAKDIHPLYPPVSRTTFLHKLHSIPPEKIERKRKGKRGANAVSSPTNPTERALKAELAWQLVAIDHYLADIFLVFFDDNESPHVMRPWITAMVDTATGSVLAFSISFLSPSRRSVAKVMRDCVRRYGCLPKSIIVDRGADFRSTYFAALLAHSKVEYVLRPSSHSRYGGEVEGLFGEFKKQWLSQRPGNITDFKEARAIDGDRRPNKLAVLTLQDFYHEFEAFINWRDCKPKTVAIESPRQLIVKNMQEYPFVAIPQKYNDEYLLATAVDSKQYKIDFQRGIHINAMWYWAPGLSQLRGKQHKVEVRIDPENPHVIYVLINNRWEPCYSSRINRFSALDPISQKIEGIIAIDAFNERQKIKQAADEELVHIIKALSEKSENREDSKVAFISSTPDCDLSEESIFDLLKSAEVQSLDVDSWEVSHDWKH